jgi:hypothetical protein
MKEERRCDFRESKSQSMSPVCHMIVTQRTPESSLIRAGYEIESGTYDTALMYDRRAAKLYCIISTIIICIKISYTQNSW